MVNGPSDKAEAKSVYRTVYGSDNPSAARRFFVNSFFVVMSFYAVGLYVDFVPSAEWSEISWRVSFSVGAAITVFVWRSYWTGAAEFSSGTSGWRTALAFSLTPVLAMLFTWCALTHGTASLVSLLFGHEAELQHELRKEKRSARRTCDHRLTGDFLEPALPSHYCIGSGTYQKLPEVAMYVIKGRQHFLGFVIDSVYLAERQARMNGPNPVKPATPQPAQERDSL